MRNITVAADTTSNNSRAPTLDTLAGFVRDAIAYAGSSLDQVFARVEQRSGNATTEQRLRAMALVLVEQRERNAKLQVTAGELSDAIARLEDEVVTLEAEAGILRAKLKVPAR
jgi:uncharacterized protein (DUF849 family)